MSALTVSAADEKRVKGLGFLNNRGTDNFSGRIITINGKLNADQWAYISEAAKKFGNGNITLTTRLTVEVQGIPYDQIDAFIAYIEQGGMITGGTGAKVRPIVSCKGTTCQYGLIDTFALSEEIHNEFYIKYHDVKLPHKFKIAVGGCPNNCVKPDLNDLGVVGQRIPEFNVDACKGCKKCAIEMGCPIGAAKVVDGKLAIDPDVCNHCGRCVSKCPFSAIETGKTGYAVYLGGRWGKQIAAGQKMPCIFETKEQVMAVTEKAILLFKEQGNAGERFQQTINRLGFENVCKQLLSEELLARKEQILAK